MVGPSASVMTVLALLALGSSAQAATAHQRIPMSPGLPSTDNFDSTSNLIKTWHAIQPSLSKRARALTQGFLNRQATARRSMAGVPGTAITSSSEAALLQEHLDCSVGRGSWVYEAEGGERERGGGAGLSVHKQESIYATCDKKFYKSQGAATSANKASLEWKVRESLKWRFVPDESCADSAPASASPAVKVSRRELCQLIAHKAITLAGDVPQFGMHDLLLDWTSLRPQSCYGDLYCKEHELCEDVLAADADEVEHWTPDERVYDHIPAPQRHLQFKRALSDEDEEDESAVQQRARWSTPSANTFLRYRRTDGLRYAAGASEPVYVNPATGVREINQLWLADSRRSDIVIVSKAPLPLPVKGINATWDAWFAEGLEAGGTEGALRVLETAWKMTEEHWLPELIDSLKAIRGPGSPVEQLIVFRGGWRSHADCAAESFPPGDDSSAADGTYNSPGDGPPPHKKQPSLESILFKAATDGHEQLQNVHTLFFNLQTIIQNELVRKAVLPDFGIPYLDMETPLSVWRSGMVGGSAAAPFSSSRDAQDSFALMDQTKPSGSSIGLRSAASGDCTRYCFPGPGMAIEEAFIGGLIRVTKRGWAGSSERSAAWVGDGYKSLAAREAIRNKGGK